MSAESINLVDLISQFYQQIAKIKLWIRDGQLSSEVVAILKLDNMPSDSELAVAVSLVLNQWIARKKLGFEKKLTDRESYMLNKAMFAMICLADELLIMELDWPGKPYWHDVLLEEQNYQSSSAGVALYHDIDELLAHNSHDELERQLAAVYLLVLRLGFSGRHRDQPEVLADYRKKLFKIVNRGQAEVEEPITTDAYEQRLVSHQEQRLAPLSNWYRAIAIGAGVYLAAGAVVWYSLTWTLNQWMGGL